jgi:hypothetical protein
MMILSFSLFFFPNVSAAFVVYAVLIRISTAAHTAGKPYRIVPVTERQRILPIT